MAHLSMELCIPLHRIQREDFEDQLVLMRETMENQGAIMVLIGPSLSARLEPGYLAEITEGLILIEQYQDGMLYKLSSRP